MSASNGLLKAHHGIMKMDAVADYNAVKAACENLGIEVIVPKGKHWHKIEDATKEMLRKLPESVEGTIKLHRGHSYYSSI
jgi:hypothetical protein